MQKGSRSANLIKKIKKNSAATYQSGGSFKVVFSAEDGRLIEKI